MKPAPPVMKILLPVSTRRVYRRATVFQVMRMAFLIAVLVAAVGCGAAQSSSSAPADTQLTMSLWAQGNGKGEPTRWTLRCNPAGGTLPRPAAACRRLAAMKAPFAPLRKDVVCTDVYGGPHQALIAGRYQGRRIWVFLSARNGCEMARWNRLGFLVGGGFAGGGALERFGRIRSRAT